MTDWVRVRDTRTGHHFTTTADDPDIAAKHLHVVDAPAVDVNGRPLPVAPHKPKAAEKSAAATAKEK